MDLPKAYNPSEYETQVYESWEKSGAFAPVAHGQKAPFTVVMPPPNANGSLHAGHASGYTIEDAIVRFWRMKGHPTLWLPGTDHAGIETQFVFEKKLAEEGKDRFDLGPEKFYEEVMKFTLSSQQNMLGQMRSMGWSADWSKLKFTLDPDIIDIVYDTFTQMHKDGLIYRGNRLVNWCSRCQAAFADIEVERQEREGTMYTIDYGPLQIATVRPETIFADVAVAVNPDDPRYKELVGKTAHIPLIDRQIPIIADQHVDPDHGTGALKVTPGHDAADYEIGQRHSLPEISVIDPEGKLVNVPEQFAGLAVSKGREAVVKALTQANKLVSTAKLTHALAIHDRCGTVIEPLISEQWFVRVKPLNEAVIKAFSEDTITVFPKRFKKIALNWLEQEHDWCISRQIWWGIRIPVYYKSSNDPDKKPYIIAKTAEEAERYYGAGNYRVETDTFDTWFSSGQWPYAALMSTGDFKHFYPTSLMGTAREILHKWVTRMVMFGLYRTKQVPFDDVYLWGLVTDEQGRKMSKSKGNVLDPLELSRTYGTDALRMALTATNTPGNDSPLSEKQIEAYRNFCNKLWNVARYTLSVVETSSPSDLQPQTLADHWIMHRLSERTAEITQLIEGYRMNEAAQAVYHLLWDDLADWYIESSKVAPSPGVLLFGLDTMLRLTHPFAPFVTEVIWSKLPSRESQLIIAPWPKLKHSFPEEAAAFSEIQAIVSELRSLKRDLGLPDLTLYYVDSRLVGDNASLISKLAGISSCVQVQEAKGFRLSRTQEACWVGVDHESAAASLEKLQQELIEIEKYSKNLGDQLQNPQFAQHAPAAVVEDARLRHAQALSRLKALKEREDNIRSSI